MTDSITPPPELVQQWTSLSNEMEGNEVWMQMAIFAAQWGADQELEECCKVLESMLPNLGILPLVLRAARRPKPSSLKEQAQAELKRLIALIPTEGAIAMAEPIRRALEQLDD
jgi:hypothetical protein